ncbi:MAG TPA: hypothetical protein V6D17_07770 [Candidatus Obscuribacterales bacterium]
MADRTICYGSVRVWFRLRSRDFTTGTAKQFLTTGTAKQFLTTGTAK